MGRYLRRGFLSENISNRRGAVYSGRFERTAQSLWFTLRLDMEAPVVQHPQ
jgi:hypothetical protein